MADRNQPLADRIFGRLFGDREVRDALDSMTVEAVCRALYGPNDDGQPTAFRHYARGSGGWTEGDPRPGLADDDPAVMQAIGRCAAYQVRLKLPAPLPLVVAGHPRTCAWCAYPVAEMMRACDWSVIRSRFVITEELVWWQWPLEQPTKRGLSYRRSGLDCAWLAPAYAELWALPGEEREARIVAAMYPEEAAA